MPRKSTALNVLEVSFLESFAFFLLEAKGLLNAYQIRLMFLWKLNMCISFFFILEIDISQMKWLFLHQS